MRQYVLYCFDTGELVTKTVFRSEQEAADVADGLNDVLVVPLDIPGSADDEELMELADPS